MCDGNVLTERGSAVGRIQGGGGEIEWAINEDIGVGQRDRGRNGRSEASEVAGKKIVVGVKKRKRRNLAEVKPLRCGAQGA